MDHSKTVKRSILLCAAVLSSCNWYDKTTVQNVAGPVPAGARVLFFNFGVGSPGVTFYADDRKMTAAGSPDVIGVKYGTVGAGGFYTAIAPGQHTLKGKNAATTDTVSRLSTTLEDGKAYSFYQSGIYDTTTKTVEAFIVEDPFVSQFDYSVAYVRFVHAISNANPMTLHATNTVDSTQVAVGAEVAYTAAGAFTPLTQRTMYLPESAAGAPGGRFAPAAHAKFQRPSSSASAPWAQTESARTVSTGGGLDIEFIIVMNPRMASRPRTGGMLGGSITPFAWYRSASESA